MRRKMENAFSVVEVLIAATILGVIGGAVVASTMMANRLVWQGLSLTELQSQARIGMEKIERYLRMAKSATVSSDGAVITFTVDVSGTTVTRTLTFSSGTLTYDPGQGKSVETVMTKVELMPGKTSVFDVSGKLITMNLRLSDVVPAFQSATYSGSNLDLSTKVYMRN